MRRLPGRVRHATLVESGCGESPSLCHARADSSSAASTRATDLNSDPMGDDEPATGLAEVRDGPQLAQQSAAPAPLARDGRGGGLIARPWRPAHARVRVSRHDRPCRCARSRPYPAAAAVPPRCRRRARVGSSHACWQAQQLPDSSEHDSVRAHPPPAHRRARPQAHSAPAALASAPPMTLPSPSDSVV